MNNKIENDNEFLIPINIRISNNDLVNNNDNINTVSYSGSIIPKEFSLNDFKKDSNIYKFGIKILNDINEPKKNLIYVPNKEWYSLFKLVNN